ncbi:MAG: ornithine carbamoyltransferase, partial [Verrucomicrobia bacterium]|nr:ornithine carbamoyltransferase [Verrucomicrobiota bacterium]
MAHFLSIEEQTPKQLSDLLQMTGILKSSRGQRENKPLLNQVWAMIFNKPSTRTRVSFEVGIRELGGSVMFLSQNEIQLGRGEPIVDTARVLGRMVQGAVIRTFSQDDIQRFAEYSQIPTINALSDQEHPCQIVADLFTIQEKRGALNEQKICFIGDGDCNVARSWIWAAEKLGLELRIAAPIEYQPGETVLSQLRNGRISVTCDPFAAAADADIIYTDVWVSMGREAESANRLADFREYQVNERLLRVANPQALVLHCLPAYRGKEITEAILEKHAKT